MFKNILLTSLGTFTLMTASVESSSLSEDMESELTKVQSVDEHTKALGDLIKILLEARYKFAKYPLHTQIDTKTAKTIGDLLNKMATPNNTAEIKSLQRKLFRLYVPPLRPETSDDSGAPYKPSIDERIKTINEVIVFLVTSKLSD